MQDTTKPHVSISDHWQDRKYGAYLLQLLSSHAKRIPSIGNEASIVEWERSTGVSDSIFGASSFVDTTALEQTYETAAFPLDSGHAQHRDWDPDPDLDQDLDREVCPT